MRDRKCEYKLAPQSDSPPLPASATDVGVAETCVSTTTVAVDDVNSGLLPESSPDENVATEDVKPRLVYSISQTPPIHLLIVFAFQQALMSITDTLSTSLLVADVVCAKDDEGIKSQILSSSMMMAGISTLLMVTFGVRLPVYQGPASIYIIPLLAMTQMKEWQCPTQDELADYYGNLTANVTLNSRGQYPIPTEIIHSKLSILMGSLMVIGVIHMMIGLTGLVGVLLRFIGPITVVPALTLIGLFVYKAAVKFSETQWGVAFFTLGLALTFAFYLRNVSTPFPFWTRKRGFHIKWFPFHQVFAILLAIIIAWLLSGLLTITGALSADPQSPDYYARTDSRTYVIHETPWFYLPYPGQFGLPAFSISAFLTFFMATSYSVLDSIGDYSACARMCCVPPPPTHAVNRGLAVEGFMAFMCGAVGTGHATASYGGNIGAIGITKVASRRVFQTCGCLFIILAIVGKIGAFFVTIPYSVIGGSMIIGLGIFIGIVLSNLQYVDLNSPRNLAIVGTAMLIGLMLPYWVEQHPDAIQTGNTTADTLIKVVMSNPSFVGGFVACFLDNTIPGTKKERGMHVWQNEYSTKDNDFDFSSYQEGPEVYIPPLPNCLKRHKVSKYIPIIPTFPKRHET